MTRRAQQPEAAPTAQAQLRLDKWLWHARFFKSRSQATEAAAGGLVHVNGERVKASRDIKIGDRLDITRDELRMEVIVRTLPQRRGPASEARLSYEETEASMQLREKQREQQRYAPPAPTRRPDKHERRALRSFKGF
ncbi:MAG: RNA-binding S4 domain-containing protein [Steroidobacteraceae bacterium]